MTRLLCNLGSVAGLWLAVAVAASSFATSLAAADLPAAPHGFQVTPPQVSLKGNYGQAQLVVGARLADGTVGDVSADLTAHVSYRSSNDQVVQVSATGRLLAIADGSAEVAVTLGDQKISVPVTVAGVLPQAQIDYMLQVGPVLSKAGCNMGACHATQHGQGGFKLSVFGFQPAEDREAIVRDRLQRRVDFIEPERSLLLRKPTMEVPHGGGQRLLKGSVDYQILADWIRGAAPAATANPPKVTRLVVFPNSRRGAIGLTQQLRVEAEYSDGSQRDITPWAKFDTMDDAVLAVSAEGVVTALDRGQAPIMVRFEDVAEISMFAIPFSSDLKLAGWTNNNFIDELAAKKFVELGIEPSPLTDDATFLRRAYLDATGTLPSVDEVRSFLASTDPGKRELLIDRLLGLTGDPALDIHNDQYSSLWTLKWSDLIGNHSNKVGEQGMWALYNWIKESFRTNKPFDQFVRELVTAKGSIFMTGPANYFQINRTPSDLAESTAQLFMGIRLQCAKCHHHPFEKYSQADYNGFSNFYSRVKNKRSEEFGLFGRDSVIVVDTRPQSATPLGSAPVEHPLDLRIPLADWLTSPDNQFFAKSVVNRYMGYLLGRGLVEPVDDMRDTNPPTNVELMDALAKDFAAHKFDLKHLMRTIMTSRLYQLDVAPTATNASDRKFYSHYRVKRISAEPLLDAIDQVTGVQTKFRNLPLGTRAIDLPDAEYPDYFLTTFAKPKRASVCECERSPDESLAQALHTLNGETLTSKIADGNGRIAKLLAAKKSHEEIVEELYLASLCRMPSPQEREAAGEFLAASPSPKECYEDLLWALINSKQFLFVR